MKRVGVICLVLALTLCGCGFLRRSAYVSVAPHDEDYGVSTDSDVLTVSSYLSLKNAILDLVQDGVDSSVIRAESYSGDLASDLSQAVYEVTQMSPLGAYAVSSMSYDYSRIVGYYEIHLNTVFKRSLEEIQSVVFASDTASVIARLQGAMLSRKEHLVLRVGAYETFDAAAAAQECYLDHPDQMPELPEITMESYPDTGSQRILDIRLSYTHTIQELDEACGMLQETVSRWAGLYGSANSQMTAARLLYQRLGRQAALEQPGSPGRSFSGSACGAVLDRRATALGYAQAYRLLMDACGIPCRLVGGLKNGLEHTWCMVEVDGMSLYVDPSAAVAQPEHKLFLMGDGELISGGYVLYNASDYPPATLPGYLRPEE